MISWKRVSISGHSRGLISIDRGNKSVEPQDQNNFGGRNYQEMITLKTCNSYPETDGDLSM